MPIEKEQIEKILQDFKRGKIGLEEALTSLKLFPYEDLGFAKIDHHRRLRKGFPEVIFGTGKSAEQVISIAERMADAGGPILITRVKDEVYGKIKERFPHAVFNREASAVAINKEDKLRGKGLIAVLAAGTSDIPVAEESAFTAEVMGNRVQRVYDVGVAGLHRLLDQKGVLLSARVVVVVAGMEGALPSVVGGLVEAPVIAVPTSVGYGASFDGVAPLLAMLNSCAPGVVVVNIDNGFGAGYFASLLNRL